MGMNFMHRRLCGSDKWAAFVKDTMPRRLAGYDLGDDLLEIGPGYGATTRALVERAPRVTALEVDRGYADQLRDRLDGQATIVQGDGAEMPFGDDRFSSVVCFTMLHHVPTDEQQDAIFAEACRVLRPGGILRGTDSQLSLRFRILHIGDTMNVLDPAILGDRLARAGFTDVQVDHVPNKIVRFAAVKP